MKRLLATLAIAAVCVAQVGADLTLTTTTTLEGAIAAMTGGGKLSPKIVTRIKGTKSRTDIEMGDQTMATLMDFATREAFLLNPSQKTAQLLDPAMMGQKLPAAMPKIDTKVKPTGNKRDINGQPCDEFTVNMLIDMSTMAAGGGMPPGAAEALKDIRMTMSGVVWVAKGGPGSAEYQSFQASASKFAIAALSGGRGGGMPSGMEQAIMGFADAPGIPYLTELTMGVEGSGPMVEMMKKMGSMKLISRVTDVSTEAIPDATFKVPDDYKVVK